MWGKRHEPLVQRSRPLAAVAATNAAPGDYHRPLHQRAALSGGTARPRLLLAPAHRAVHPGNAHAAGPRSLFLHRGRSSLGPARVAGAGRDGHRGGLVWLCRPRAAAWFPRIAGVLARVPAPAPFGRALLAVSCPHSRFCYHPPPVHQCASPRLHVGLPYGVPACPCSLPPWRGWRQDGATLVAPFAHDPLGAPSLRVL